MTFDGHKPSYTVIYLYRHIPSYDVIYFPEKYIPVYTQYRNSEKVYTSIYPVYDPIWQGMGYGVIYRVYVSIWRYMSGCQDVAGLGDCLARWRVPGSRDRVLRLRLPSQGQLAVTVAGEPPSQAVSLQAPRLTGRAAGGCKWGWLGQWWWLRVGPHQPQRNWAPLMMEIISSISAIWTVTY